MFVVNVFRLFASVRDFFNKQTGKAFHLCWIFLLISFPTASYAGVVKPIHIEWDYDTSLPNLAGYVINLNNQAIIEITNPSQLSIDHDVLIQGGQNVFTMTAFDQLGNNSDPSTPFIIEIPPEDASGNILPTAEIQASAVQGDAPMAVDFDASGSSDFDGMILEYNWNFGDGTTDAGAIVGHVFQAGGIYPVTLTVKDDAGATAVAQTTITVNDAVIPINKPPVLAVKTNVISGFAPLLVNFDASSSSDPDGYIVQYAWNFGDGSEDVGQMVDHIFQSAGVYQVMASITDNDGAVTQKAITIRVDDTYATYDSAINFQPERSTTPVGFTPDIGQMYDEANGYGWTVMTRHKAMARERNSDLSPDKAYDTLILVNSSDRWEMALPNGTYSVTVCMGDPAWSRGQQSVQAEDIPIITNESLNRNNRWIVREQIIEVRDGRLTLTFNGNDSTVELDWVKVVSAP